MEIFRHKLIKNEKWIELANQLESLKKDASDATDFVKEIETGNLEAVYQGANDSQSAKELAASLVSMRDKMKKLSIEDKQRSWTNEGLAQFVEILRANNENLESLSDNIIRNLVKYLNANQGLLFLLNDEDPNDIFLEVGACYAYNRKKFLKKRIEMGQGLAGQAIMEKDTIYMTDVPEDFVLISSGLGESLPRNILIVPLKIEQQVFGVIEIASFHLFKPFEIQFIEKLSESIASTISAVRVSERTRKLLEDSQFQAEQLRSQEEEIRQNMEELSSTQEEMERVMAKVQTQERYMTSIINASKDSIVTIDKDFKVVNFNTVLKDTYKQLGFDINVGFDITSLLPTEEDRRRHKEIYKRVLAGENVEMPEKYKFNDIDAYYIFFFTPIRNEHNEIVAIAIFVKDVTEIAKAKDSAQQQAEDLRSQEEELRKNMEELSTTQEEMHRILKEVQDKEAFTMDLINSTNDSILAIDKDYKIILCNKTTADSYVSSGLKLDKGFDIFRVISPEQKAKYKAMYDRAFAGEHYEITENYKFEDKDQYYAVTYSPLRNDKGEVIAVASFGKDITESVLAKLKTEKLLNESQQQEEELRQNMEELSATQDEIQNILKEIQSKEKYLTNILNASDDMIVSIGKDFKVISSNTALKNNYKHMGFDVEKGFDILNLLSPEEQPKHKAIYARVFAGEKVELAEHYKLQDMELFINFTFTPMPDEQGDINSIAIYAQDVTEITRAKNEIESNERNITELLNVSGDSIMTIDRQYKVITFNTVFSSSFKGMGITIAKGFEVLTLFNEKDQSDKVKIYERVFAGETYESLDHLSADGLDNYYSVKHAPLYDKDGKIESIAIFAKDITEITKAKQRAEELLHQSQQQGEELKAQEEELRQNMEELSTTQDEINRQVQEMQVLKSTLETRERIFGITTILSEADVNGTITMVNDKLCEVSQFSREELIGQPHNIFRHPDMPKELFKSMWKSLKKGEPFVGIIKNKKKDGSHYWVDAVIVPVKDETGKITKYIGARYHYTNDEIALKLYNDQAKKMNFPTL